MMRKRTTLFNNAGFVIFCMTALLSVVSVCNVNAQTKVPLKANVDNVYVTPGGYAILDLLKNDEFGDCNRNTLKLSIIQMPSHGTVIPIPATNNVYYIPTAGFTGQDKFGYRITCGGVYSDTIVNVSVYNQPSNVMTDVCFVPRPETVWDIQKKAQSTVLVHDLATPFVGDLDGDGISEVVTPGVGVSGGVTTTMIVLNNNLTQKYSFSTPRLANWGTMTHLIADVDNDGQGEIVVATTDGNTNVNDDFKLVCFTGSGIRKWTSNAVYTTSVMGVSPVIGDINNDGYSEILVNGSIYAGESGKLLVTLPPGGRGYAAGSPDGGTQGSRMPALADLDGDGKLEVAAGNTTYKITITNRSGTSGNSAVVLAQIADIDGFTSIADINLDGKLDVVVTGGASATPSDGNRMYVWDGVTPARIGTPVIPLATQSRISRAFIGDITGNGRPDIALTYTSGMSAYYYDPGTNTLKKLWDYPTTDTSGATTMSMFDFNQDGISELIYRDETDLRIINGSMKSHKTGNDTIVYNLAQIPCYSATHTEYPIIADFDRDGHADILVSGDANPYVVGVPRSTRIMWFGSKTPNQWAPCRTVWNQHGFNPVYIDEKLVPIQYPVNPGASFYEKGTGKVNRPFNNFLQQTTTLNEEGTPLYLGPDLYFDNQVSQKIYIDDVTDKLVITIGINNQGNASYEGNLRISTYVYDSNTNPSTEYLIGSNNETVNIAIGQQTIITYSISNYSTIMHPSYSYWEIRLNWEGNTYPINQTECKY
jgi:hypothetical protein